MTVWGGMRATELIAKMQAMVDEHGDLAVYFEPSPQAARGADAIPVRDVYLSTINPGEPGDEGTYVIALDDVAP
jgi:hypothetical protein